MANTFPILSDIKIEIPVREMIYRVRDLKRKEFDFDIYLPKYDFYLQRDIVWNEFQQSQFIESLLIGRMIPPITTINAPKGHLVLDGKQRLNTILSFINNKSTITVFGNKVNFFELPDDYKVALDFARIKFNEVYVESDDFYKDDDLIDMFNLINFAGTPIELEHKEKLIGLKSIKNVT